MPSLSDPTPDTFGEARANLYDLKSSKYRKSGLTSRYDRDEGLLAIPVMGPADSPPVIVRVHAPVGYRVVEFEYAREGAPPVFPAQADTDNDTMLASELTLPAPIERGSSLVFGCKGRYTFVQYGNEDDGFGPRGTETLYPIDRHPFPSLVDLLGAVTRAASPFGAQGAVGSYNCDTMDARYLSSYGILG